MKRIVLTLAKTLKKILIGLAAMAVLHFAVNSGAVQDFVGSNFLATGLVYVLVAWVQFIKSDGESSFSMMGQNGSLLRTGDQVASRMALQSSVREYDRRGGICWLSSLLAALFFLMIGMFATM